MVPPLLMIEKHNTQYAHVPNNILMIHLSIIYLMEINDQERGKMCFFQVLVMKVFAIFD